MGKSHIAEAFILGTLIFLGLSNVEFSITVNMTDKPIINTIDQQGRDDE